MLEKFMRKHIDNWLWLKRDISWIAWVSLFMWLLSALIVSFVLLKNVCAAPLPPQKRGENLYADMAQKSETSDRIMESVELADPGRCCNGDDLTSPVRSMFNTFRASAINKSTILLVLWSSCFVA